MKKLFYLFWAVFLLSSALIVSCTTLEVSLPKGPKGDKGDKGESGFSAYELWVQSIKDGIIDWDGSTEIVDFFIYMKGEKGDKGDDGADGKDGVDGADGKDGVDGADGKDGVDGADGKDGVDGKDAKSSFEMWQEYIASGDVEDPHNPANLWDPSHNSLKWFYYFISGSDGDNGNTPYIGENGNWWIDGTDTGYPAVAKSTYEIWVKHVLEGGITDADGKVMSDTSFVNYYNTLKGIDGQTPYIGENGNWFVGSNDTGVSAKGEKGDSGVQGDKGDPGVNGGQGLSAYDLWKQEVEKGLADPANPGEYLDKTKTSIMDFFKYIYGNDGPMGLSAYETWKNDLLDENGLANPGNGIYDIETYPKWPKDKNSEKDFYDYLRGADGKNGEDGEGPKDPEVGEHKKVGPITDSVYIEEAIPGLYNLAPVRMTKIIDYDETTGRDVITYDFVDPITGGVAYVVTSPDYTVIPNCTVTFQSFDGGYYTRTSDAEGYIYLTRFSLPVYYPGSKSAKSFRNKPLSFTFDDKIISNPDLIAQTCTVPYQVRLETKLTSAKTISRCTESMLENQFSLEMEFKQKRIVEGKVETVHYKSKDNKAIEMPFPKSYNDDGASYGYYNYMCKKDSIKNYLCAKRPSYVAGAYNEAYSSYSFKDSSVMPIVEDDSVSDFYDLGAFGAEAWGGKKPNVHTTVNDYAYSPLCYGRQECSDSIHIPEIRRMPGLNLSDLKGDAQTNVSYQGDVIENADGTEPVKIQKVNYEMIPGVSYLNFILDYDAFGQCYSNDFTFVNGIYEFKRFNTLRDYIVYKSLTKYGPSSMFIQHIVGYDVHTNEKLMNFSISSGCLSEEMITIQNIYDGYKIVVFPLGADYEAYYAFRYGVFHYSPENPYEASIEWNDKTDVFQVISEHKTKNR